jgi:hypothetical protein
MIHRIVPPRQSTRGIVVEFMPQFLSEGFGRKVYYVDEGYLLRIPSSGFAHIHACPDYLVPILGEVLLAYRRPDNRTLEVIRLEIGYHYRIPPFVPHQVEIRGGILESFYPYRKSLPTRECREDFFSYYYQDEPR